MRFIRFFDLAVEEDTSETSMLSLATKKFTVL
jgi:hypothetical protein